MDEEFDEELRFHLDRQIQANLEAGMSPAEAERAARLTLGHVDTIKEVSRDARPGAFLRQTIRDLVYGVRLLRRAPAFTITSILIVALGVGMTTAVFSVLYGVALRPLPYPDPASLVGLWTRHPQFGGQRIVVNGADYRDWRTTNRVFEDIALVRHIANFNLIGTGDAERLFAARISANLLPVLGVTPAIGRNFTEEEDEIGHDRVVLLSDGLWKRRFGGDAGILGRAINLSGVPHVVVGVMPPDFQYPSREYQLWTPLTVNPRELARTEPGYNHLAVARLKRGISVGQAQSEMDSIARNLGTTYPASNRDVGVEVVPLLEDAVSVVRPALYLAFAAVSCLLFISCLNLANLLGARATSRNREYAMRLALGASRERLALQALTEIAPVLVAGAVLGVACAAWGVAAFLPLAPAALPRVESIAIDGPVLAFSLGLLLVTGIIAGLLPARQAWRSDLVGATQDNGRSNVGGRSQSLTRNCLVVAQIALVLPLLVGAGLLARSFSALVHVDPGFRPDNVLSLQLAIARSKYRTDEQVASFCTLLMQRVATVPGVASVGMVNRLPLSGTIQTLLLMFDDWNTAQPVLDVDSRTVAPDYFGTIGIPLIEGRVFTDHDTDTLPLPGFPNASFPVVGMIDERIARTLWPGRSALGKRFRLPFADAPWVEIIGVVGHIRHDGLDVDPRPQVYFNYLQRAQDRMALVVKSREDVRALAVPIVEAIRSLDPEQPVYDVRTMDEVLNRTTTQRWLNATLVTAFALLALLLASVGLYGVVIYGVTRQTREFGVRLALGAQRSDITRLVLGRGVKLAAGGAVIGLAATLATTKTIESLLYGVQPLDPVSFLTALALLVAVALLASYMPARRAASTNPAVALRFE